MKEETKKYLSQFQKITGVKPTRCKLCVGSMKEFIFIEIKGTEEEYNKIFETHKEREDKLYNFRGVLITFIEFSFDKTKLRFHIQRGVLR